MKTIIKIIASAAIAVGAGAVLSGHDVSDNLIVCTTVCIAIMVAAMLGVFDSADKSASEEGRVIATPHSDRGSEKSEECNATLSKREFATATKKNYGRAAIFVGTAAIFVGTPQECEDVADDLWHYAQQARVEMLSGEETFEIL